MCAFGLTLYKTFRRHGLQLQAGLIQPGVDHAMEGTVDRGRTYAVCIEAQGWGEHVLAVPRVRHLSHRTLKIEATRPAGANFLQQQAKFDTFVSEFNDDRPHEALDMKCPADVYKPSTRPYRGIGELSYPFHDRTALVTYCGRICIFRKKINLSTSLAGQTVGIKEVDDGIWLVTFMDYDLGYIDLEEKL